MVTGRHAFMIRAASGSDIPAIAGLLDQLNRFEGYTQTTDAVALKAALSGEGREVKLAALVAHVETEVIGALLYYPGYDTLSASVGYHLADMVVDEFHRKRGIGKALMKSLAQQALAEGKSWISLTALKQNAAAHRFYASLGMSEIAVDFFAMGKTKLAEL